MASSLMICVLVILVNAVHFSTEQTPNCTAQPTFSVGYRLEFPMVNCSGDNESLASRPEPALVSVECGVTAQNVMEQAVRDNQYFTFTATFIGGTVGYRIDAINGTVNAGECVWFFYYQELDDEEPILQESVTDFVIQRNGSTVILRYQTEPEPPTTPTVMATTGSAYHIHGLTPLLVMAVAFAYGLLH